MKKSLFCMLTMALSFAMLAGCTRPPSVAKEKDKTKTAHKDDHEHGEGPHGGTIVELTVRHGEITFDHKKHEAILYILDDSAKKAAPIAADSKITLSIKTPKSTVEMKAEPEKDDPAGKASRFVAKHEHFSKEQEFEGEVAAVIDGKQYTGTFKEEEDHKHDKHDKDKHDKK